MSVIGGQNTPSLNGLAYIIDFNNNYTSGSSTVNPVLYFPTSSQFTGSVPNLINGQVQFTGSSVLRSFQNFPGFNPNTGNLTIMFSGEVKNNAVLFTQDGQIAVVATTSSIGYGVPAGNVGRNFPNVGFDHVTLRFSSASVDCFVNGVPVSASGIFPTVPSSSDFTDFKIGGNYLTSWTGSLSGSLGQLMVYNRPLSDDEIYSNYLIQARRYGLSEVPKPYTVDSSVYVYSQAAGITDTVTLNALNTFVQGLKSASLWDKMVAIYPFIGVNSSGSRLNLKDVSLNTTQVNYSGSWSTSLSGSYNNNTASYGILSNITPTYVHPLINSQSIHLSYLSYDTPVSGGYLMGVEEIPGLPGDIAAPAAAYSVRKVRTAYTGSALRVRRDFDDVTFDVGFDASGNLDTGSLLTKMTASITTTLPGDYSGLAAAYSLRRVSSSYSGYAIEVRRAVDNYSASIGFDGSGNLNTGSLASFIRTGSETPVDAYSGLAAAYSLRKVVPSYAGDAIEIQSGSVSQSIGFDSFGDLDVAAIKSFAGSGDAFVKTWYDQSGNGNNSTAQSSTQQPKIVSAGTVLTVEGKPAMLFDGVNDQLNMAGLHGQSLLDQYFVVSTSDTQYIYPNVGTGGDYFGFTSRLGNTSTGIRSNYGSPSLYANGTLFTGTNRDDVYYFLNGYKIAIHQNANTSTWSTYNFGNYSSYQYAGYLQELIAYTSSQADNRTYIENNINSYYGIYTPTSVSTENAYVKTWYDQSGNNRHAIQTTSSQQPQIVSLGTLVTESGKASIKFDGVDDGLITNNFISDDNNIGFFAVQKINNTAAGISMTLIDGIQAIYLPWNQNDDGFYYGTGYIYSGSVDSSRRLVTLYSDTVSGSLKLNGRFKGSRANFSYSYTGPHYIGRWTNGLYSDCNYQEIVIFNTSQTSSVNLIEDNINGYYNIFTHSLDSGSGYVTTWYDQSENDRHASQATASLQPLILSSGSLYVQNNKPAVYFNGVAGTLLENTSYSLPTSTPVSFTAVVNPSSSNNNFAGLIGSNGGNGIMFYSTAYWNMDGSGGGPGSSATVTPSLNTPQIITGIYTTSRTQNSYIFKDGTLGMYFTGTGAPRAGIGIQIGGRTEAIPSRVLRGFIQEAIAYTESILTTRQPIEQNTNTYFNVYTPLPYNTGTNSLSLFSSPTVIAGGANAAPTGLTTGGPTGLITVSRTGSGNYALWKNRVPTKTTLPASVPLSNEIYLNAANVSNALFSGSQTNVAYASVGAGLTDDEVYTYYELVDDLQTSLNRGVTDPTAFITTWDTRISGTGTISNTSSIVLPLYGTQAITASWGDGTQTLISSSTQTGRTHSYATPGVYTVSITGQGQGFQFNNGGDRLKLIDVGQWGSISGSTSGVFYNCFNLRGTAADNHILETANIDSYFREARNFNGYINNWDVSGVTIMDFAFRASTAFNQDLSSWDVSNVTSMGNMFNEAVIFNQNLGSWNVSNVTDINNMFYAAYQFNNGGSNSINNWNVAKVTNMRNTFGSPFSAMAFNQPLNSWNTSNVTNMSGMFSRNGSFNQNIGSWNVEKVTDMNNMFFSANTFNNSGSSDINNWRPISCSNFTNMFWGASAFNQPIGNWPLSASSINMFGMFKATSFNQDLGSWDVSKVLSMNNMFQGSSFNNSGSDSIKNWRPVSCSNFGSMFYISPNFNQPIGSWPISASNIDMSYMFASANSFNQNLGAWNVEKVINMSNMFQNNTTFNNSGSSDINNWRPISCSNFTSMFNLATAFNQPIGDWTIGTINEIPLGVSMTSMFRGASSFNQGINTWDMSNVRDISFMFDASGFNQPLNNWDVSRVTTMERTFRSATLFNQDIGSWNVSSCINFNNFMANKTSANYSYLHTIYDGWINNKLQPRVTASFNTIQYSASAAEGRALLTRTYNTSSVIGSNDDFGQIAITCSANHNVVAGNKIFISGSSYAGINGVQTVFATGSATTLTIAGVPYDPSATNGLVITGYGWNITDGGPV